MISHKLLLAWLVTLLVMGAAEAESVQWVQIDGGVKIELLDVAAVWDASKDRPSMNTLTLLYFDHSLSPAERDYAATLPSLSFWEKGTPPRFQLALRIDPKIPGFQSLLSYEAVQPDPTRGITFKRNRKNNPGLFNGLMKYSFKTSDGGLIDLSWNLRQKVGGRTVEWNLRTQSQFTLYRPPPQTL